MGRRHRRKQDRAALGFVNALAMAGSLVAIADPGLGPTLERTRGGQVAEPKGKIVPGQPRLAPAIRTGDRTGAGDSQEKAAGRP